MQQIAKNSKRRTGIATILRHSDPQIKASVKEVERTLTNMGVDTKTLTSPQEVEKYLHENNAWMKQQIGKNFEEILAESFPPKAKVLKFPEGGVDKVPVTKQFTVPEVSGIDDALKSDFDKATGQFFSADDHIKFIKSKEPIESMKEANALIGRKNPSYKGRYKNITDDEAKQILKDTEDHIFQRDVVPDEFDPDYASGGRIDAEGGGYLSDDELQSLDSSYVPDID